MVVCVQLLQQTSSIKGTKGTGEKGATYVLFFCLQTDSTTVQQQYRSGIELRSIFRVHAERLLSGSATAPTVRRRSPGVERYSVWGVRSVQRLVIIAAARKFRLQVQQYYK